MVGVVEQFLQTGGPRLFHEMQNFPIDFCQHTGSLEDQGGIDLGNFASLFPEVDQIGDVFDASTCDCVDVRGFCELFQNLFSGFSGAFPEQSSGVAPLAPFGYGQSVGGDDSLQVKSFDQFHNIVNFPLGESWGYFDKQGATGADIREGGEDAMELVLFLKVSETGCIGRGDVDGQIVAERFKSFIQEAVVHTRLFFGSDLIFANIDAQNLSPSICAPDVVQNFFGPHSVESEMIAQGLLFFQAE